MAYPFQLLIESVLHDGDDPLLLFTKDSDREKLFASFTKELLRSQNSFKDTDDWYDFIIDKTDPFDVHSERLFEAHEQDLENGHPGLESILHHPEPDYTIVHLSHHLIASSRFVLASDEATSRQSFDTDLALFLGNLCFNEKSGTWYGPSHPFKTEVTSDYTPALSSIKENAPHLYSVLEEIGFIEKLSNQSPCPMWRSATFSCQDYATYVD